MRQDGSSGNDAEKEQNGVVVKALLGSCAVNHMLLSIDPVLSSCFSSTNVRTWFALARL